MNAILLVSQDIALGKDTNLFFEVAGYLLLISIVGGLADFITLGYTSKFGLSFIVNLEIDWKLRAKRRLNLFIFHG